MAVMAPYPSECRALNGMSGTGDRRPLASRQDQTLCSSPLDRSGPDPQLILMGRRSEPDPDSPLGPSNGVTLHQFLDAVFPQDPGVHRMWGGRGGDRELPQLLRLEAAGLTLGEAWTFGHAPEYRTGV